MSGDANRSISNRNRCARAAQMRQPWTEPPSGSSKRRRMLRRIVVVPSPVRARAGQNHIALVAGERDAAPASASRPNRLPAERPERLREGVRHVKEDLWGGIRRGIEDSPPPSSQHSETANPDGAEHPAFNDARLRSAQHDRAHGAPRPDYVPLLDARRIRRLSTAITPRPRPDHWRPERRGAAASSSTRAQRSTTRGRTTRRTHTLMLDGSEQTTRRARRSEIPTGVRRDAGTNPAARFCAAERSSGLNRISDRRLPQRLLSRAEADASRAKIEFRWSG